MREEGERVQPRGTKALGGVTEMGVKTGKTVFESSEEV